MNYYDLEAIKRFIDTISKNLNEASFDIASKIAKGQQIDIAGELDKITLNSVEMADIRAMHRALAALLYAGVDLKKELGLKKKRVPKKAGSIKPFIALNLWFYVPLKVAQSNTRKPLNC